MSKKVVANKPKFPETVYVYYDEFGDDVPVLLVSESPQHTTSLGIKTIVGVYTLSKTVYTEGKVELTEVK